MPPIFHITHVENLPSIIEDGGLLSDAVMIERGGPATSIGMSVIKERRLRLPVKIHPGDSVGQYVPFYFCPRSIMLYLLYMGNHPELTYRGGQGPIVHLQADAERSVEWAEAEGLRWAFSLSNAGAAYAEFRCNLAALNEVNWDAVAATDFRDPIVKDGKQAEFLVLERYPWGLIENVGVRSEEVAEQVRTALGRSAHPPPVHVRREWYF